MMEVHKAMIRNIPVFVREVQGEKAFEKWLKAIPVPAAELFRSANYSVDWYDSKDFFTIPMIKMCELFYHGSLKGVREQARFDVEKWLIGLRKLVVLAIPESMLVKSFLVSSLHRYFRIVDVKIFDLKKGYWVFSILGLDETEGTVAERFAGGLEFILQMRGKKDIKIQVERSHKEHKLYTMYEVTYRS
jgi:hypothetical protein